MTEAAHGSSGLQVPGLDFEMTGTDPYDALKSPIVPRFMIRTRVGRQAIVQARKLTPVDLSRPLGIRPYVMAKTVGCALSASARSAAALGRAEAPDLRDGIGGLVTILDECEGTIGDGSFGYEFDVQTRWAFYAAGSPNVIATVFIARGLAEAGLAIGRADWLQRAIDAATWIDSHLYAESPGGSFYSYVPGQTTLIHNASLLAASLCCALGVLSNNPRMVDRALSAVSTSIGAQDEDGSWPYGEGGRVGWVDNFHTAYNLDALHAVWSSTGSPEAKLALENGLEYWQREFFRPQGEPRYYPQKDWPVDIHCAATAVDVAARLALGGFPCERLARSVMSWTEQHMVRSRRATVFRRYRYFSDGRRFPRWGDAHWAMARASILLLDSGHEGPLEAALNGKGR